MESKYHNTTAKYLTILEYLNNLCYFTEIHEGPKPKTTREDWHHGTLSRSEAKELLKAAPGNSDGRFLVRYSENKNENVLTMMWFNNDFNFVVKQQVPIYILSWKISFDYF